MQLDLPDGATEKEQRRVRQEVDRVQRNAAIRDAYPDLKQQHGWREAVRILADRHCCSQATVRAVVRGQR